MESSVLENVKNHKVCTPISKLSGSFVKIDSISIDLANANQKIEMGNCNHFSIRGYVAEIRKKDKKICWPFSNDDNCSKTEEHISRLLPLQAAKFRWWRCENCRRDIDPQGTAKDIETDPNCNKNGVKSNTSANFNTNGNAVTSCKGHVNSSKNDENHEFSKPSSVTKKIDPCSELERRTSDKALMLKYNGFMETWKPNCGVNEASVNELNITKLDYQMKKDDKHKNLSTVCGKSRVSGIVNESGFAANGRASAPVSCQDSGTSDCGSSESDEMLVAYNSLDQHHEDSSFSHRQKPRKIRLLAELLDASRNAKADAPSVSQNQRDILGKDFTDKTRKRKKMAHEGNCRLPETSSPNSESKKSRISIGESKSDNNEVHKNHLSNKKIVRNRDEDDDQRHILNNKMKDVGIEDIASTPQISTGRAMDPVVRNHFPVQESPRKSSLCKKKNNMPQVENLQAFLMPWNNDLLRKNSSTRQNAETMQTWPEVQAYSSSYENFLAAQQIKRNLMPLIEHRPDFVLPKGQCIYGDNQVKRKLVGSKYIGESSVPCKPVVHAFNDKVVRWDLGIKRGPGVKSLVGQKHDCPSRAEDGDLSSQQKMGAFGRRNGEKGIKVKKHPQTDNELFEQRATDDIPMEIIELLAKNQYEKRLQNAGKNSSPRETTYKQRNGENIKLNNVHANGDIMSLQQENSHLGKSQPDDLENNMCATQETVKSTHQKPVINFPHMSLQDGNYISQGLHAFSRVMQSSAPSSSSIHLGAPPSDWSSTSHNHVSYKDQTGTLQKENVNGNPVPKPFDLNVASYEKQNPNFGSQNINKVDGEHRYGCHNGIELFPNLLGPKALYSNETIPAMHLLSLMDPGMRSITPFDLHENPKVLTRTPFIEDHQHLSSVDYRKNPISEKSCECAFTLSLQNDISNLKSLEKGKAKRPYVPKRSKIVKSHEYAYTNSELRTNFDFTHAKNTQRFVLADSTKHVESNPQSCETDCPMKGRPKMEICSLNRNPADFTIPEIGNIYMIGAEDFNFSGKCSLPLAEACK